MVILKKLYSETGLFDRVNFISGINIIRGVYTTNTEKETRDINGVGKSTLVRLIDFALLSDSARSDYFNTKDEKYAFLKGHSVVLEFEADGRSYFIKRVFEDSRNPKFGMDMSSLETYEEAELRSILSNLFFGRTTYNGYFEAAWFRKLLKFFIKDDINNFERKDPLNFIDRYKRKFEIYAYNLFLLDLPNRSVVSFDELKGKIEDLQKQKRKLISRLKEETGKKIEEVNSEIVMLDEKIKSFERSITEYKFLGTYTEVENRLVVISTEISSLLIKLTSLKRKLNEYKKSYEYEIEIDTEQIAKQYSEIKDTFGGVVKNKLDDVIAFRKKLAENRQIFLKDKEAELNQEIKDISSQISSLEEKRAHLYKLLDEKKELDSIKNTYTLLIEEKTKKERLLTSISDVNRLDEEIYKKKMEITQAIASIAEEINQVQDKIKRISALFFEIIGRTFPDNAKEAVFDIRPNPEVASPLRISVDVPKSAALGNTRFKILAYDLTVFLNIITTKRNLPRFLIHDGIFHGIGIKTVVRTLNLIHSKHLQFPNFQYIITANENEISVPSDKKDIYGKYDFNMNDHIIATYKDNPEQMIFKREYA